MSVCKISKFGPYPSLPWDVINPFIHFAFQGLLYFYPFTVLKPNCYIFIPGDSRTMGSSDYQNSIFYLNDGLYHNIMEITNFMCYLNTFENVKCPKKSKKVSDIYERVPK